jgi:Zn-finger nucleic acid-binding protein
VICQILLMEHARSGQLVMCDRMPLFVSVWYPEGELSKLATQMLDYFRQILVRLCSITERKQVVLAYAR